MTLPPDDCHDCLKGLVNNQSFFGNGHDYTLFSDVKPVIELTGWNGSSVNWDLPEGGALEDLLNKKKNGEIHFKAGAVRVPRIEIDKTIKRFGNECLAYELREENDNKYHGHILFCASLEPKQRTTICSLLANSITEHHERRK
jgi:hypothetical protein